MAVNIKQRLLTAGILIPIVILCATNRWGWVLLNMGNYHTKLTIFRIPNSCDTRILNDNGKDFIVFVREPKEWEFKIIITLSKTYLKSEQ